MHRSISSWTKVVAAALLAAVAAVAHAGAGNGIRFGGAEGRLHPFLDLETRYDSNVSYSPANEAVSDVILHVRPGIDLKIPGELASVEFSGALDWANYLGIDEPGTKDLSKFYGDARLAAQFARRSAVSVRVDDDFRRQVSTSSLSASSRAVVSNWNALTLSVPWKPGGGALVVTATGQWLLETFETYQDEAGGIDVGDYGYSQVRGGGEVLWRFLPRTSAVFSGGYFTRTPNSPTRADEATGFDVAAGITGLLTPRIAATAKAGYAATSARRAQAISGTTTSPTQDASTFVTDVGVEWLPLETLSLRVGYTRALGVDPLASVYVSDGVNGAVRIKIAERFAFRTGARYDQIKFSSASGGDTTFLRVDPGVDGVIGRWLNVGVGYVYSTRVATWPGAPVPDYSKNEVFLKVGLTY
jgi:hypothetical protein